MAKILGTRMDAFRKGNLVSTLNEISNFTPEDTDIEYGELLVYGTALKQYTQANGSETADRIAGVAVMPSAQTPAVYPSGKGRKAIKVGEFGDVLIRGDVVVELSADDTDPTLVMEGGLVYMGSDGKVSALEGTSPAKELLHQFVFLGNVETVDGKVLVTVRKKY